MADLVSLPSTKAAPARRPRAPAGLGDAGRRLWRNVHDEVELDGAALDVLHQACQSIDRIARIEAELAGSPLMVEGSRSMIAHPLLHAERQERRVLLALLGRLEVDEDGKLTPSQRARKAARARWG